MVYVFKVTLTGIKGFYRVYHLNPDNSLYSFHKQMRADMEFPQDQVILFKGLGADLEVVARYGLFTGKGIESVDEITIAQAVKKGIMSFVYFYDAANKKSVNISFEGIDEETADVPMPTLVDIKGPNPIDFENGYVAFEDLPDDQRHLPSESDKARNKASSGLAALLSAIDDEEDDESSNAAEDIEDEEEEEEEDTRERYDDEAVEIFDGSEELTL